MKKVLLTLNNSRLSGIEKFTVLLAKHLDKSKFKVDIGIPTYGPLCELLEQNKIDYFIFDNKLNGRYSFSGILFLVKYLFKNKYDIIHAQAGIVPCLIGTLLGTKLVIEHKHGLDFTSEQIDNLGIVKLSYECIKKYLVNKTFTGCKADKQILINRFNYKNINVDVIYNGIEKEIGTIAKRKNDKFTIGTIGRLTFQKGQEYIIETAKILVSKGYNFEFHIYGEGEKHQEFGSLIKKYHLENNVFLKGYSENISETMKTFDIFVLPSRYEGIPYVILEAMKAEVPVISSDVGGINEVIINMVNGILIRKENVAELVEKIILLFESEKLKIHLTQKAKKDFDENYTIEKTINSIESFYSL